MVVARMGVRMSSTSTARVRAAVIAGVAVLAAFLVGLFLLLSRSVDPLEETAAGYLGHLSTADGHAACTAMTRTAQAELAATYRVADCPAAVGKLLEPLTPAQRDELAGTDTRFPKASGVTGHVDLDSNPLGLSHLVLKDVDGKWLIAELK
ncbi:hypothetical protein ACFWVF_11670 [Streptomyces sp. NPDC058659]|uniref:hypothetical protein n=1 Tax=unclassified Streptomyces TaxID=2593676 RepID=UPI0036493AD9